MNKKSDLLELF